MKVIVRKWLTLVFQPFDKEFVVVDAAANGHEALEICRIHAIDIVITDIIMPDMDGMSFIQARGNSICIRKFNLSYPITRIFLWLKRECLSEQQHIC